MKIVSFEPGDGTSYYVIYHPLTPEERDACGGGADILFGFGTRGDAPYRCYPFRTEGMASMHENYFNGKLAIKNQWTHTAALIVFGHLARRDIDGDVNFQERRWAILAEWLPNWKDLLTGLTAPERSNA